MKQKRPAPYNRCPEFDSANFHLRLVTTGDAKDLLRVYSNPEAIRYFNEDAFTYAMGREDLTLAEMRKTIRRWRHEYKHCAFVRFALLNKKSGHAVGTVEIFGGDYGCLRIDLLPDYEREAYLAELLTVADEFFACFDCSRIVSKAIPAAAQRIAALKACGYTVFPRQKGFQRDDYYMKQKGWK
ncbi:MAG: GNAT family N-acetyltransferase [Oscillospiraceae bacterium]|jgi:RimJ/RimL family protein N-acetyltransferase|nr:GNAT family N-acetyltransferase [Oscillospiraceae bacterium]